MEWRHLGDPDFQEALDGRIIFRNALSQVPRIVSPSSLACRDTKFGFPCRLWVNLVEGGMTVRTTKDQRSFVILRRVIC
jgi:hypothetical protein